MSMQGFYGLYLMSGEASGIRLKEMFNVHPAFVHFPIALIPVALLLYFLGTVLSNCSLNVAVRACLYLALFSGAITVLTGLTAVALASYLETLKDAEF